jgi:hypothetical protein
MRQIRCFCCGLPMDVGCWMALGLLAVGVGVVVYGMIRRLP